MNSVNFGDIPADWLAAVLIVTGEKTPYDEEPTDSESSDVDSTGETPSDHQPIPEIQQRFLDIAEIIACLFKLSIAIRSPAPHDRLIKSAKIKLPHFEPFDLGHAVGKFPDADKDLTKRLGLANIKRREQFEYRKRHHERLVGKKTSEPRDKDRVGFELEGLTQVEERQEEINPKPTKHALEYAETIPSTAATTAYTQTTAASTLYQSDSVKDLENFEVHSDTGQSQTSYTPSITGDEQHRIKVPPLPKEGLDEKPFECPYCFTICIFKGEGRSWKNHVFKDLQPYVCTFGECPTNHTMFATRHEWFNHELHSHRREWFCSLCNQTFKTKDACEHHMEQRHLEGLTEGQLSALVDMCERPVEVIPATACPLCDWDTIWRSRGAVAEQTPFPDTINVTAKAFRAHVGRHLEQLALFALPKIFNDEEADVESGRAEASLGSSEDPPCGTSSASDGSGEGGADPNPVEDSEDVPKFGAKASRLRGKEAKEPQFPDHSLEDVSGNPVLDDTVHEVPVPDADDLSWDNITSKFRDAREGQAVAAPLTTLSNMGTEMLSHLSAEEFECLRCLYTSDYQAHRGRIPDRIPGTCEWLLRRPQYQRWSQMQTSDIMWITADPGCEKSVLASFLIDELSSPESQATLPSTVCYFFFEDHSMDPKGAKFALCALLHQLFTAKSSLISHAMSEFRGRAEKFTEELGTLWNILTTAAASKTSGNVICIIDGLDKCEELTRVQLIQSLVTFYSNTGKQSATESFLKFVITSRPYRSIEDGFLDIPIRLRMEVETDLISRDIEMVVKAKVEMIGMKRHLSDLTQATLMEQLVSNASRSFLWVSLVLEDFENGAQIPKSVSGYMPATLDAVYNNILGRSSNIEDATKLLHIVVAAVRPLSLKEMSIAFFIKSSDRSYEDIDLEPSISDVFRNLCGLFVKVIDSKIYLIHPTAKEFLTNHSMAATRSPHTWKHSLNPIQSNLVLTEICISYLMFDVFESHPLAIDPELLGDDDIKSVVNQYTSSHEFLDYAANNWAIHFREAKIREEGAVLKTTLDVCDTRSNRYLTWFQVHRSNLSSKSPFLPNLTELMVGSYFGLEAVVRLLLLEAKTNVNAENKDGDTALYWGARSGHEAVVRLLLESKANVNAKGVDGHTALHVAAFGGHKAVVQLLLEAKANVDTRDNNGITPLYFAAHKGHEAVVRLLVEAKANVDSKNNYGRTALREAARNGHEAVVRLLLEAKADVDVRDDNGLTGLYYAAKMGHEAVVRLLVEAKANVDTEDNSGATALYFAARGGHEAVVRLLLEAKANVDAEDKDGLTALYWAARNGQEAVERLLLEAKTNVDAEDNVGQDGED